MRQLDEPVPEEPAQPACVQRVRCSEHRLEPGWRRSRHPPHATRAPTRVNPPRTIASTSPGEPPRHTEAAVRASTTGATHGRWIESRGAKRRLPAGRLLATRRVPDGALRVVAKMERAYRA